MTESAHGTHAHDTLRELAPQGRELRAAIPEVYEGYAKLTSAAYADGVLSHKIKELIALAIGVVDMCDGCIATHARGAAQAGATREEVAEALGVTIAMRGGPGTVHGPRAYAAFLEFEQPASSYPQGKSSPQEGPDTCARPTPAAVSGSGPTTPGPLAS